jgi:BON domain
VRIVSAAIAALAGTCPVASAQEPTGDPFLQLTAGIAACPAPAPPRPTLAEQREQAHGRTDRGTTCYLAGRCRLPNAYLYDAEIIPRVRKAVEFDGRFAQTSVWAEGRRRWVWLKGCVRRAEDGEALERLVRSMDDVEAVVNELVVTDP